MALISNPRSFLLSTSHFERDGAFVSGNRPQKPDPGELFSCSVVHDFSRPLPRLPNRIVPQVIPITYGQDNPIILFGLGISEDIPLFWQAELFTVHGRVCDEATYNALWRLRRSTDIAYVSLDPSSRPLQIRAEGHLLDLVVYFALFEAHKTGAEIVESLGSAPVRGAVAREWEELTASVMVNLKAGRKSLTAQLTESRKPAAELATLLTRKPRNTFRRFFEL